MPLFNHLVTSRFLCEAAPSWTADAGRRGFSRLVRRRKEWGGRDSWPSGNLGGRRRRVPSFRSLGDVTNTKRL